MTPSSEALTAFARRHRVRADIRPHFEIHDRQRVQTGFDLTLVAAPSEGCNGDPGCGECQHVHDELEAVARAALPVGWRHAVEPFDAAFHYRRWTAWRPEIEAVIQMLPADRTWEEIETSDRRELLETLKRLLGAGVGQEPRVTPGIDALKGASAFR